MSKICSKCGNSLDKDTRFCTKCGTVVSDRSPEEKMIQEKNSAKIGKLLKNPKALFKAILPALIIAVIWTLLALLEMAYPKSVVIRLFSFFTYAQGGMLGGFFGALGGIVGKGVFAYLLCTIVNAGISKRKINFQEILAGFKINGLSAIGCFLIGAGAAMLLYLAMNITSSAQNAMIGVVGAVMIAIAAGQKNGLLLMAVCGIIRLLTCGKAPSQVTVSHMLSGMAAGFIIAVPLSLLRSAWICPAICFLFLAVGVLMLVFRSKGKNKKVLVTMVALTMALSSLMPICADASDIKAASGDWVDPYAYWNLEDAERSEMQDKMKNSELKAGAFELKPILYYPFSYSNVDYYQISDFTASNQAWVVQINKVAEDFKLTYAVNKDVNENESINDNYEVNIKNFMLSLAENATYMYKCESVISGSEKTYREAKFKNQAQVETGSYEGSIHGGESRSFSLDIDNGMLLLRINFYAEGELTKHYLKNSEVGMVTERMNYSGDSKIIFQVTKVLLSDSDDIGGSSGWIADNDMGGSDGNTDTSANNGDETRKGVPLKDYDKDGDIDFVDRQIQYELIHDPDYLTRNGTVGVLIVAIMSIISGIMGGVAGVAAGMSGATSGAIGETAAGSIGAASPYIKFDEAGDIEWTDPATGKITQYVRQKDGKYKNPLTDQSYTYDELSESAAYRERNAESFAQDAEEAERNVEEQRAASGGLSDNAKEHAEVLRQLEAIAKDREKMVKLANKYYLPADMDKDELIKEVLRKMDEERACGDKFVAQGKRMEIYEKTAEAVSTAADLGMDALATMTGPAGKAVNAAYKVGKGAAGKGAEEANCSDGSISTGIMQGAIEGGIDAANDYLGGGAKTVGTVMGETAKSGLDSYIKGEDVVEGMKEGAAKGMLNAAIDAGADAVGNGIKNATAAPKGVPIDESVFNAAEKTASAVDAGTSVADNLTKEAAESVIKKDDGK